MFICDVVINFALSVTDIIDNNTLIIIYYIFNHFLPYASVSVPVTERI